MTIREFVLALCSITGEPFSPKAGRTFLAEITQDRLEVVFAKMKPSTFNSYFRQGRNLSKEFASDIEAEYSQTLLKEYLKELAAGRGGKQRLCDVFSEYCPGIEPKTAIRQIIGLFEKLLKGAKRGRPIAPVARKTDDAPSQQTIFIDNNGAMPTPTQLPVKTEQVAPRMLTHDRESLAMIIEKIANALQHVQDPLHDYLLTWAYLNEQERAKYEAGITSHVCTVMNCSKKLDLYAKRYPEFSELSWLCKNGQKIFTRYYAVHTRQELSDYETYLKELCDTMDQASIKLRTY